MNCNVFGYQKVTFLTPPTTPLTPQTFRSPLGDAIVLRALRAGYFTSLDYARTKLGGIWVLRTERTTTTKVYLQKLIRIYTYGIAHTLPRIDAKQGGWVGQEVNVKLTLSVAT